MKLKKIIGSIITLTLVFSLMTGCNGNQDQAEAEYDEALIAATENGKYVGLEEDGVIGYKGIPYAKAPIRELRWKAPVACDPSDEVYEAYDYGLTCLQTEWFSEGASYTPQGEDCLSLNVWTTELQPEEAKPVMVFIHGGSYSWGGTADPLYDGHNFVERRDDVVLVTINYRLGLLGFMDLSQFGGDEYLDSANLGLLDQIAALEWIQKNITAFGGDPDNVTIFGESAGGGSVSLLLSMDRAQGLFNKVIAQSGAVVLSQTQEEALEVTDLLIEETGAESMEDLLALDWNELVEINESLLDVLVDTINMPTKDGRIVPLDPYQAIADGAANGVQLLSGTNADEWNYWVAEVEGYDNYVGWMTERFEMDREMMEPEDVALADEFIARRADKEEVWQITDFYNDLVFRIPAIQQTEDQSKYTKSYMYYWTYPSSVEYYEACHAVELAYVFNNLHETMFTGENPNKELAEKAQDAWVNFAVTGDPSIEGIKWLPYDSTGRATMFIGENWEMVNDPLAADRELLTPLLKYWIR